MISGETFRPTTAFASYASEDRATVLRCIAGLTKAAPHLDVFIDVASIRSGEDWQRKLFSVIATSDIFYLFWSAAASKSEWVEREWRTALAKRGLKFIDPFPLVSPELIPPPQPLSSLHFGSIFQQLIQSYEYVQLLQKQQVG